MLDSIRFAPSVLARPGEIVISPWSIQSLGVQLWSMGLTTIAATAWPAAGLVIYYPFGLPEPITITKLWWSLNAAAGNLDCAILDEAGNVLVSSGSTAAAGTDIPQTVDVTDTRIGRGRYYAGLVADTVTTLTIYRVSPAAGIAQSLGLLEQTGVTLPLSTGANPATFAKYTRAYIPLFGLQGYRAVGP